MMMQISEFLSDDHKYCDELFSDLENSISAQNYDGAIQKLEKFANNTLEHFQVEEEVLFPPIEEMMGTSEGPTYIMKMEHAQMRQVIQEMVDALKENNYEHFLGLSDTFMILLQQHNSKEEQILYAMADDMLIENKDEILNTIKDVRENHT
jgi:hemerythrin-like domain-containing protein